MALFAVVCLFVAHSFISTLSTSSSATTPVVSASSIPHQQDTPISIDLSQTAFVHTQSQQQQQQQQQQQPQQMSAPSFQSRKVLRSFVSRWQGEGDGAKVRRSIGHAQLRNFDPFLMLDEFSVNAPAGFPDHPHRGFETVTYMLKGRMAHEDFAGHKGVIGPGDLQWMTAGKGILHAEMPASQEEAHGLQLWVNLAAKDKMVEPAYQELKKEDIPSATKDGVKASIIAGEAFGVKSPVYTRTPTHYIHFFMQPGTTFHHDIPEDWNAFIYVLEGEALVGREDTHIMPHTTVLLEREAKANGITVKNPTNQPNSLVLLCGRPNNEPIVQHGPFVMNTQDEIYRTFEDYRAGRNGFERAAAWQSEIGNRD